MYRVCFEVFRDFFAKRKLTPGDMKDESKWFKETINVPNAYGENKPIRVEVVFPPEL
jgi:hypothetical protein